MSMTFDTWEVITNADEFIRRREWENQKQIAAVKSLPAPEKK